MISETRISILNAVNCIKNRLNIEEVQPKDIIDNFNMSHQTIFVGLSELVSEGYLDKRREGKFRYYKLTSKGEDMLQKAKELEYKSLTEPFINKMANQLIEERPEDFKGINYNVITEFLDKQIKELEKKTLSAARDYFVRKSNSTKGVNDLGSH